jgi:hypothetical protein
LLALVVACGGEGVEVTTTEAGTTPTTEATTSTLAPRTIAQATTTTTQAATTTTAKPVLTQQVAASSLETVSTQLFEAWLVGDDSAYPEIDQAITDVVREVLASHGPIPGSEGWQATYLELGREGMDDLQGFYPEGTLTLFAELGVPGAPTAILYGGLYRVGETWIDGFTGDPDRTATPGTYVAFDVEDCYWETLDDAGEINDNNFVSAAPRVEVTIRESDLAFNSEGCGRWVRIGP